MAAEGADTIVTGRTKCELDDLKADIQKLGRRCDVVVADLSTRDGVRTLCDEVNPEGRRVDILVNNAAVGGSIDPRPTVEFDDAVWDQTLFINLTAPYLICKRFIPPMAHRNWGRIINVTSGASKIGLAHAPAYASSKHGLLGLTRTLALEYLGTNVTINAYTPGVVATAANEASMDHEAQRQGKTRDEIIEASTPFGRRFNPEEMTPFVVFLATPEARFINGQSCHSDGGGIMW
jgi:NAD(P)-dependent dehydrogenase (short-subunit alcohol dehydrogenase family)